MRALAVVVLLAAATEARAQGGVPISFGDGPEIIGLGLDASLVGLGLTSAVFGTAGLLRGEPMTGWLILSGLSGAVEIAVGIGVFADSQHNWGQAAWLRALGASHLGLGLVNLALPVLGIVQRVLAPSAGSLGFTPMALGGKGPGGSRWSGIGVEVKL